MAVDSEKGALPPYNPVELHHLAYRRRLARPSRGFKYLALACLGFIVFAQWRQMRGSDLTATAMPRTLLSVEKLREGLATCVKLQSKPKDPIGEGRTRSARYIDGHKPTLIKNAMVWIGEAAVGTSEKDAHKGKGYSWTSADVFVEHGLIKHVGTNLDLRSVALTSDYLIYDAMGRPLTSGIIDMHSHAGVGELPMLQGDADINEVSADITPFVRSIDGIRPLDHQIQVIKSGGVTTSLVLPGSGNNIGGEAFVIKHAVGKHDGRNETSATDMLADPERNWRYMKMACGENPKRIYGKIGEHGPFSRLGESWEFRHAFETAAKLVQEQDDWCRTATELGLEHVENYLPQDLKWESLGAVLRGQVHVNTHCYTIPDLEAFVDHSNEFKFPVRAFHHAHETFLVPEILKRAYGPSPPASALFADNMWYKAEAYLGSEFAGKVLWENGLTPIYVSDNPVLNAQHVVFEAAKAYGYGLPYHVAMASVTTAPAERLGLGNRLGKVKPGYDADIVVWDSDPLSVGATPVQVWIDGTAQFDDPVELQKPLQALEPIKHIERSQTEAKTALSRVVFTGVTHSYLEEAADARRSSRASDNLTVAITDGKISCIGTCEADITAAVAGKARLIHLKAGYLTKPFVAFGSNIGLAAVDSEATTSNGVNALHFSRAIDGLRLDVKKLHYAYQYGVTRAISAPTFRGSFSHFGTSVGFETGALHTLQDGAVFADDVAVHYTLDGESKAGGEGSVSAALGALRTKLLKAARAAENSTEGLGVEESFLHEVVHGRKPLVFTVHSADGIASALRLKKEVETVSNSSITMAVIGGGESHLVATELAAANVGVVLAPMFAYRVLWDHRRALTGAPLTNGTAVDLLAAAGVKVAVGLEEDWLVRDMGLLAGIVCKNSGGNIAEREALDMVSSNVYEMLGMKKAEGQEDFVVFEGSPLEVGGWVRAVGTGKDAVTIFD
jgi:imidazolonepropionase-like amidohydrolase